MKDLRRHLMMGLALVLGFAAATPALASVRTYCRSGGTNYKVYGCAGGSWCDF